MVGEETHTALCLLVCFSDLILISCPLQQYSYHPSLFRLSSLVDIVRPLWRSRLFELSTWWRMKGWKENRRWEVEHVTGWDVILLYYSLYVMWWKGCERVERWVDYLSQICLIYLIGRLIGIGEVGMIRFAECAMEHWSTTDTLDSLSYTTCFNPTLDGVPDGIALECEGFGLEEELDWSSPHCSIDTNRISRLIASQHLFLPSPLLPTSIPDIMNMRTDGDTNTKSTESEFQFQSRNRWRKNEDRVEE